MLLTNNRTTRKVPRVFLQDDSVLISLTGILLQWPDRTFSPVLDLSLSGIAVPVTGLMSSLKIGQEVSPRLRLSATAEPIVLKMRIQRMTANQLFLGFDSLSTEGRLQLEQPIKDELIRNNFRRRNVIRPEHQGMQWFCAPFETNVLLSDDVLLCEYESLLLKIEKNVITLQKTSPTSEEARGYFGAWVENENQKVSMGASWVQRLIKVLATSHIAELKEAAQFLESLTQD